MELLEYCKKNAAKALNINHNSYISNDMTDPILYISMILGLIGIYILISSFGDDDDDNGGDGELYLYNLEFARANS